LIKNSPPEAYPLSNVAYTPKQLLVTKHYVTAMPVLRKKRFLPKGYFFNKPAKLGLLRIHMLIFFTNVESVERSYHPIFFQANEIIQNEAK
jgi:hypothetical protein